MCQVTKGTLYGLSLGPGDPGLITRRSWELLNSGRGWCYPVRALGSDSYAHEIVRRSGCAEPQRMVPLHFPMIHDQARLAGYWLAAAEQVREILCSGEDLLFLVEGDASTYSTFSHLQRTLLALDPTLAVEVVAGVTSYSAAAAATGRSLADSDDTIAILPAGYGVATVEALLPHFDTLVLLKVKPLIEDLIDLIERLQLQEGSYFVERVGTPEERQIHDVATLRGTTPNYLSLMIIHNPERTRTLQHRGCRQKSD
ncbi:MAG: precorrin-2 C(20)-methyltransferase [Gammaproteobacteria bacterium]|nr:precorrin-2 C(20)-methyltransferase [Gammaproteobacteria bacterium]